MDQWMKMPIFDAVKSIMKKEITIEKYVSIFLENIVKNNKKTNALIKIYEKESILKARFFDQNFDQYKNKKLLGIPCIVKDIIQIKGSAITVGSGIFDEYISPFTATVVQKLLDEGVIIIGKSNLDEMAIGSSNKTSKYNPVANPHDLEYVPGGSSGGSASAIAGNFSPIALGTDTGGSIRQPSSWCGVVGLKPTYGRVSRYGVVSHASSLDVVGPITRSVEDNAYVMEVISGFDEYDLTSSDRKVDPYFQDIKNYKIGKNLKIALIKEYKNICIQEYEQNLHKLISVLEDKGVDIEYISIPEILLTVPTYFILAASEANSNFSRFSGIFYPYADLKTQTIQDRIIFTRSKGFGLEVKKRIILGDHFLQEENYDEYLRSQNIRILIQDQFKHIFKKYDFILSPTTAFPAFKLNSEIPNKDSYNLDKLTIGANYSGIPAISIPFFKEKSTKLPMGIQIMADLFQEKKLFQLSYFIQETIKNI